MSGRQNGLFPDIDPIRTGEARRLQVLFLPKLLQSVASESRWKGQAQDDAYSRFVKWADLESSGKLRKLKESNLRGDFLQDIFGDALGYTRFSEGLQHWHLWEEFAVPGGEADAALGFFGVEKPEPPRALIELKSPKVNIDRDRFPHRTPVQQCWDYLIATPACPWGLVCNFVSFRLYHRNKGPQAFEHFTLQELRDRKRFNEFYYILSHGGLLPALLSQKARADELLEKSEQQQLIVGRKLYKHYQEQRLSLIRWLRRRPPEKSIDDAIHIAQTLLDRAIFIAFCKDRALLPKTTLQQIKDREAAFTLIQNPRWQNLLNLFRSIDEGNSKADITSYNGGLFERKPEVDGLELPDELTRFFTSIGEYDFENEVNVDVLGHLFEHSITDLEALRANPEMLAEKQVGKAEIGQRRRQGVYYTPPQITRHIIEHTLKPCLDEQFAACAVRCGVNPQDIDEQRDNARWLTYQRERLQTLQRFRVCDPACGSGAFLIEALNFLVGQYDEVIGEIARHEPDDLPNPAEIRETILRENLFGVDRSDEAVQITRLALWIRTAEKGRKLSDLSHNILVGNSLVPDAKVDPLAFDWESNFPQVFAEGKFDCVIGNPPYVKLQNFRQREPKVAAFLVGHYRSAQSGNFDLFLPFIERGLDLLKPTGRLGFIAPSLWLFNEYGDGLRQWIRERTALERFVDFKSFQVFEDATTYTALQFFSPRHRVTIDVADASGGTATLSNLKYFPVRYDNLGDGAWALLPDAEQAVLEKMRSVSVTLEEATSHIFQGLITSADAIYHLTRLGPGRYFSKALQSEVELEDEIMRPLVSGKDAVPFATPPTDMHLLFPYRITHEESRLYTEREMKGFRRCWNYLKQCEAQLRAREHGKMDHEGWYGYVYPKNLDKHNCPKILVPRLLYHLFASGDPKGTVYLDNVDVGGVIVKEDWNLDYILALLNSQAVDFYWRCTSKPFRGEYRSANKQFIAPLPIPRTNSQKPLVDLAQRLAERHGQRLTLLNETHRRFLVDLTPKTLLDESPLPASLPRKLQRFDELPINDLIAALQKFAQCKLKPQDRAEWDQYLTAQIKAVVNLNRDIEDLTHDLNDRVNKLFRLTEDDLRLIDASPAALK